MRGLIGWVGLLVVLVAVGMLAKRSLQVNAVATPGAAAMGMQGAASTARSPQQHAQQAQQALDAAARQAQERIDAAEGAR